MNFRAFPPWIGAPLGVVSVIGLWATCKPHSAALAAGGAIVAVLGVITLGRPVIRLGYQKWREGSQTIDGGYFSSKEEPPEYQEEMREQKLDASAVQVYGPILVSVGTLLNGFSGFVK